MPKLKNVSAAELEAAQTKAKGYWPNAVIVFAADETDEDEEDE